MLLKMKEMLITAYGNEDTEEAHDYLRTHLFETLASIKTASIIGGYPWVLEYDGEKIQHGKKCFPMVRHSLKVTWKFIASEDTVELIERYFNEAEVKLGEKTDTIYLFESY